MHCLSASPAVAWKFIEIGGNLANAPTMKLVGNSVILGVLEFIA